jgi:hypothetical protein
VADDTKTETENDSRGSRYSSIDFPYGDGGDAEDVVNYVYRNAGTSCSVEQLAGFMKQAARGGGFRTKINTTKTFGYIDTPRGQVVLTDLGRRIVDPAQQAGARVEGFMNVGLFRALYEKFKGNVLPPKPALTREIQNLGVIETQADRARQVFERSAELAGFFAHGRDRIVMPVINAQVQRETAKEPTPVEDERPTSRRVARDDGYDPLIQGLLNRLPQPGGDWPADSRATWLRALVTNFDLLYTDPDGKRVVVNVES